MSLPKYLVACGDSFLYGSDLSSTDHTWPALLAQNLDLEYVCFAQPGVGNAHILQQVIQAHNHFQSTAVYIINWTWIDRFDYVDVNDELWHTVRPACDDPTRDSFYYRYFHSELADKFYNLVYVNSAQDLLQDQKYLMTYMDSLLLDQEYHAPDYVRFLQNKAKAQLCNFQGKNFLDWSKQHQYPVSERWHPLESAHAHAAMLWQPQVASLIQTPNSNK